MQRTVFDRLMTPGQADKNRPALESAYPPKTHEHVHVKTRIGNRRRVRVVIQRKKGK